MSRPQCKLSALVVLIAVVQVADGFTAVHLQSCKRIGPGAYPGCPGFVVSSDPRSNLKALCSKHRSLTAPRILVMHASQDDGTREKMASGYLLAGGVTVAAWAACALGALATYKPWRYTHNAIGVLQALTAVPLIVAVIGELHSSCLQPQGRVGPTFLRLNLALAASSLWSAITVVFSPAFTSALVRTVDPVVYPPILRAAAAAAHLMTAGFCLNAWRCAAPTSTPRRLLAGSLAALALLGPHPDTTRERDHDSDHTSAEFGFLAAAFAAFTAIAAAAPFPLATVPSLLGKRMARAFGAWTLLAAAALLCLRQRLPLRAGGAALRRGMAQMACGHLALVGARLALESTQVYPAAMACIPVTAASLLVYALVIVVCTWPPSGEPSQ